MKPNTDDVKANKNLDQIALLALHGVKGQCPVCYETGIYDTTTGKGVNFEDAIWFNRTTKSWECRSCWLK